MPGDKGQGALEYLLILAAVLAIAVVVILVAHQISTPARESTLINQDKYSCSQAGIELLNYNQLYESEIGLNVTYLGEEYSCAPAGGYYLDFESGDEIYAACKIHNIDGDEKDLTIARAHKCGPTLGGGCGESQEVAKGCFVGEFSKLGSGGLEPKPVL